MSIRLFVARVVLLAVASACLPVSLFAGRQESGSAPTDTLSGAWTLNKELSTAAPRSRGEGGGGRRGGPDGGPGGMPPGGGPGRMPPGGPGGGMMGRGDPGGRGAGPMGGAPDPEQMKKLQAVMEELLAPSPRLTVTQTPTDLTIVDAEGRSRKFTLSGKSEKHQLTSATVETKTRLEGDRVKQEIAVAGMTITRFFTLNPSARQLVIVVQPDGKGMAKGAEMRQVYDPVQ